MRFLLIMSILMLGLGGCAGPGNKRGQTSSVPPEVRGVWLTNVDSDVLTSRESIAEAMDFLAAHNFNVVFPVVWNKAYTLYPSKVMADLRGESIDPLYTGRDPLQELIIEAHRVGIEVIPWFEYGFAASYNEGGGEILKIRPGWAAIDKEGKLATKNNFEWMNAMDPAVQQFVASLVLEVAAKYDVDGIQGDDRLPALPTLAGYDEYTRGRYRAAFGQDPPADEKDPQWVQWRADILTEFLAGLRSDVKTISQDLIVSMSPSYYDWALYEYLQDSKTWTERGLVDALHPQAYRYSFDDYKKVIDDIVSNQFTKEQLPLLSPGILVKVGSYRIPADVLLQCVAYNRKLGVNGEVHFFYEGLRENGNELATALKNGPYRTPAVLPWRAHQPWRPGSITIDPSKATYTGEWSAVDGVRVSSGVQETATFMLDVPVTAVYDIYTRVPPGVASNSEAVCQIHAANGRVISRMIDQGNSDGGWTRAGTSWLEKGTGRNRLVLATGTSGNSTAVGPVLLLLNRRQSGALEWSAPEASPK